MNGDGGSELFCHASWDMEYLYEERRRMGMTGKEEQQKNSPIRMKKGDPVEFVCCSCSHEMQTYKAERCKGIICLY